MPYQSTSTLGIGGTRYQKAPVRVHPYLVSLRAVLQPLTFLRGYVASTSNEAPRRIKQLDDGGLDTRSEEDANGIGYPRRKAIILVVDVVESVRLMQIDEQGVISRWRNFSRFIDNVLLDQYGGRLVKNLGDGLMIEFGLARRSVQAAAAIHDWWSRACEPLSDGSRLAVRAGLHAADVFDASTDIYGIGVNLASRIAAWRRQARP